MASIKAQIETVGLLVIVILIILIIVFVLQFTIYNQEPDNLPGKLLEIKANNLRNAVLKTTLCKNFNVEDEILNCFTGNSECFDSCDQLNLEIKKIIENSIQENYEFNVKNLIELKKGICDEKEASVCQPLDYGLDVCVNLCFNKEK